MAHEFGPATRGAHRALFKVLEKALARLEISGDIVDRSPTPGTVSAYKSDLRNLCDLCEAHLADPSMREHLKKNRGKGGGFFSMSRLAESAGPGGQGQRTPVLVLSRTEGDARVLEMERYNAARMNGRPADHPVASGGGRLLAAMTRDLSPDAAPAKTNGGVAVLHRAMGVAL
jgi:hypothetical protein